MKGLHLRHRQNLKCGDFNAMKNSNHVCKVLYCIANLKINKENMSQYSIDGLQPISRDTRNNDVMHVQFLMDEQKELMRDLLWRWRNEKTIKSNKKGSGLEYIII